MSYDSSLAAAIIASLSNRLVCGRDDVSVSPAAALLHHFLDEDSIATKSAIAMAVWRATPGQA